MQANWSLILNVLLLIGVVIAIGRLMKSRRQNAKITHYQPTLAPIDDKQFDDIIAVRKINYAATSSYDEIREPLKEESFLSPSEPLKKDAQSSHFNEKGPSLMMFLLAKENRQLAGYELLQTLLAAGLRFGEGNLFHRHQHPNGQGPILCSLAAATPSGIFDLQNIGAFSARGLCLFMQASTNSTIDAERFAIMYETALQLREGLDAHLLDEQKQPLTELRLARYYRALNIPMEQEVQI